MGHGTVAGGSDALTYFDYHSALFVNLAQQSATGIAGKVTNVETAGEESLVDLDVWTENTDGSKIAVGQATVAIPGGKT